MSLHSCPKCPNVQDLYDTVYRICTECGFDVETQKTNHLWLKPRLRTLPPSRSSRD